MHLDAQSIDEKSMQRRRFISSWEKQLGSVKNCSVMDDDEYKRVLHFVETEVTPRQEVRHAWSWARRHFNVRRLAGGSTILLRIAG